MNDGMYCRGGHFGSPHHQVYLSQAPLATSAPSHSTSYNLPNSSTHQNPNSSQPPSSAPHMAHVTASSYPNMPPTSSYPSHQVRYPHLHI